MKLTKTMMALGALVLVGQAPLALAQKCDDEKQVCRDKSGPKVERTRQRYGDQAAQRVQRRSSNNDGNQRPDRPDRSPDRRDLPSTHRAHPSPCHPHALGGGTADTLGPMAEKVKGPASYFPSIEAKYGRPIAEWKALIRSSDIEGHMKLVAWLKAEHGLGHGHANALVADTLAEDRDS